jgi:hypothetical protein
MGHRSKWWGLVAPSQQRIAKSAALEMTFQHR